MKPTLSKMEKRILIIGGLGFIGSNIAAKAVQGGATVTIFDACLDPYGWNFANIAEVKNRVKFIKGDTRDLEALQKAVLDQDVIIDCAAQVSHTISIQDPLLDLDINCRGALNICTAVRQVNDSAKVIYAGSRGQIGRMQFSPITEEHPTNPVDFNGIDKLAAEKYYLLHHELYGLKTASLRINNTYGPKSPMKRPDYGIINWFIRLAMENKPISLFGDGSQTRDYNFVEDVADAFLLAANSDRVNGKFYLLGSQTQTTLAEMTKKIVELSGSKSEIRFVEWPADRKAIEIGNFVVSIEKIKRELGWNPKIGIDEGLKRTLAFYRKNKTDYF